MTTTDDDGQQANEPTDSMPPLTLALTDEQLSGLRRRAARECGLDTDEDTDEIHTHWDGCACRQWALAQAERAVARLCAENAALGESVEHLTAALMQGTTQVEALRHCERLYREATAHALQMNEDTTRLIEQERAACEARDTAMREIVAAVADGGTIYYASHEGTFCVFCNGYVPGNVNVPEYDGASFPHGVGCLVTTARALLAGPAAEGIVRRASDA